MNSAITLTFGDVAENHVKMQKLGKLSQSGFSLEDLNHVAAHFNETILVKLNDYLPAGVGADAEDAYVLIIKNGVNELMNMDTYADELYEEQSKLDTDKFALMYGKVVNKHARHNLCFGYESQEPDYATGKGRVYSFNEVPRLNGVLQKLYELLGLSGRDLYAEGNYYYDPSKTGIGYHGDSERRKVIGVRLGPSIKLSYAWFYDSKQASNRISITNLEHGDIYIMSEKAVGTDWKQKKKYTLRHAAGCDKYTTL
jgi:alkylated DNA repair dioxygenase AlkB